MPLHSRLINNDPLWQAYGHAQGQMVGEGIIENLDIKDTQGMGDQNMVQAALGLPAWEGLELAIQAAQVGLPHQLPQGPATAATVEIPLDKQEPLAFTQ